MHDVEDIKQRARKLSRYYFKGFGNLYLGIVVNTKAVMRNSGSQEEIDSIFSDISKIESAYMQIPYDELEGDDDFLCLFEGKNYVRKTRVLAQKAIYDKDQESVEQLVAQWYALNEVGTGYGLKINTLFDQIHEFPGEEDFKLDFIDFNGYKWNLGYLDSVME